MRKGTTEPIPDAQILVVPLGARGAVLGMLEQINSAQNAGRGAAGPAAISLTSDRDGRFAVSALPPGQYTVTAQREGFFGPETIAATQNVATASVSVIEGAQTAELLLSLTPGAAVEGRVHDLQGRPLVSANAQAFRLVYQAGRPNLQQAANAQTNDRGEYRLYRLPPGDYYLSVTPAAAGGRGFGAARGRGATEPAQEVLPQTFHPDATDVRNARLLELRGGEELFGMDFILRPVPTIKVSGQVTTVVPLPVRTNARGAASTPPAQLFVLPSRADMPNASGSGNAGSANMNPPLNGTFELTGISRGSYDLFARVINPVPDVSVLREGNQPAAFFGRASFEAGVQDLQGVTLVIRPGVPLNGQVTIDGSREMGAAAIRIFLQAEDNSRFVTGYQQGAVRGQLQGQPGVGPDGAFSIPFVNPGTVRLTTTLSSMGQRGNGPNLLNAYVEDIREGGVSVYDNGLNVGIEPPRPIEIVVKTDGGVVSGVVLNNQQTAATGTTVVLVPELRRRQNPALYKVVTSGVKGQFTFYGVAPGAYTLFAWESVSGGQYQNPEFLSRYVTRGRAVVVGPRSTVGAQLSLIPAN
jgi:hypothetical protein